MLLKEIFIKGYIIKLAFVAVMLALVACSNSELQNCNPSETLEPDAELGGQALYGRGTICLSDGKKVSWFNVAEPGLSPNEAAAARVMMAAEKMGGIRIRPHPFVEKPLKTKKSEALQKVLLIGNNDTLEEKQWKRTLKEIQENTVGQKALFIGNITFPSWLIGDSQLTEAIGYPDLSELTFNSDFAYWACESSIQPADQAISADSANDDLWQYSKGLICGSFDFAYEARLKGVNYSDYLISMEEVQGSPVVVLDKGLYESLPTEPVWTKK